MIPLLGAIFLDLVGFGMMFPDIQLRAERLGARGWMIGGILASYYLLQMLVSPRWGTLSDRWGRKPVLLICGALSAGSMLVYALGDSIPAMLISRAMAGLGAANVVVAQAAISDRTSGEGRSVAQGRLSAMISAGLVFGPALGGFLAHSGGSRLVGLAAAALSLAGTLWLLLGLPNQPARGQTATAPSPRNTTTWIKNNSPLWRLFLVATVAWFALACLEGTFGRLIERTLGLGQLGFGLILALDGIAAALQGLLFPFLVRRLRPEVLLRTAYLLQAIGLVALPFAPNVAVLILLNSLYGIGLGIASPTINALASTRTPEDRQGEVFGLLQSVRAMGFLLGPIIGGTLFDLRPHLPYLAAAGTLFLAAVLLTRLRPTPEEGSPPLPDTP